MPVFFSLNADVILSVLCCALLLSGVTTLAISREKFHKRPLRSAAYVGVAFLLLGSRELLGIYGLSEPGFISWYPVAAILQTIASLCLLIAAKMESPKDSSRYTLSLVFIGIILLILLALLLYPFFNYDMYLHTGRKMVSSYVFFASKLSSFVVASLLLYCMHKSGIRPPPGLMLIHAAFCFHAFLIFVCRPPGLPLPADLPSPELNHFCTWLFYFRVITAVVMVVFIWDFYARAIGVTGQIRWWPPAFLLFLLAVTVAFVMFSAHNYQKVVRANLAYSAIRAASLIPADALTHAAQNPGSANDPAVAEKIFSRIRNSHVFHGYSNLESHIDALASPPKEGKDPIPVIDIFDHPGGGQWAIGHQLSYKAWEDIRQDPGLIFDEGLVRLEPLLITSPIVSPDGNVAGAAIMCVSATDLIRDLYLFKRFMLLFLPLAFFGLMLLISGQQRAWLSTHSSSRTEALRLGALGNDLIGVLITDGAIITDCNQRFSNLVGLSREELIGGNIDYVFHILTPGAADRLRTILHSSPSPDASAVELALLRPDQQEVHLLVYCRPLSDPPGDGTYIWENIDITGIKAMEKQIAASRDYLQMIIDTIPVAVFVKNNESRYQMVNRNFADILGIADPSMAIGKRISEISPKNHTGAEKRDDIARDMRGETLSYDRTFITPEGEKIYAVSKTVKQTGDGENDHILIGSLHDMTERQRVADAIREERHFLEQLINTLPVIVCFLDKDRIIRVCDKEFCREAGVRDAADLIGKPFDSVGPFGGTGREQDERMLARGRGHMDTEFEIHKDGRNRNFILRRTVMTDPEGKVLGLVKAYWDTTALVAANHAAKKADRAKAAFLANMSHELRTPMNGIVGMADLVIDHETTEPVPRLYAETIIKSAKTLQMVIDEVMDVATLDDSSRRLSMGVAPFPLLSLTEEAAQIVSCIVESWGVELSLSYDFGLGSIYDGDARHVRQIMVQILTHCSRITADKRLRLEVFGTGDGKIAFRTVFSPAHDISPEELESMFKRPSEKNSASRTLVNVGMFNDRIGLPLAWRLIDVMKGTLTVTRRGGQINCETILPLSPSGKTGSFPLNAPNLNHVRVLVATPNPERADPLGACLRYANADVDIASNRDETLRMLRAGFESDHRHDLLIFDARVIGEPSIKELQDFISEVKTGSHFGNPEIVLVVSSRQVQDLTGITSGIRSLLLPPLCPSEIWYKTEGLAATRNEILDLEPAGAVRKPTTVKIRRRSTRITRLMKVPADVLLVEDNTVNQMVAMGILKRIGSHAVLAKNGEEAVEIITSGREFDLILMDCMMPVMDGYEATSRIRLHERNTPGVKRNTIVAITANSVAGDKEKCLAAGMDDYITKPVTLNLLRDAMAKYCPDRVTMVDQAEGA